MCRRPPLVPQDNFHPSSLALCHNRRQDSCLQYEVGPFRPDADRQRSVCSVRRREALSLRHMESLASSHERLLDSKKVVEEKRD